MRKYLTTWNENTSDRIIETAYELVEDKLPAELQGIIDIAALKKHGDSIQKALRVSCMRDFIAPQLSCLHAMARGMRNAELQSPNDWKSVQSMGANELETALQGTVSVANILDHLYFRKVPDEKQEWIKNWIKNCDEKTLKKFLHLLTGSNSLGKRGLVIGNTSLPGIAFHTCFNILDFPFDSVHTEQDFKSLMESSLTGKEGYTAE